MAANTAGTTQSLPPVTLVLGGARSGKSSFAERMTVAHPRGCVYLATAGIGDDEMAERVRQHRARREAHWRTVEAPLEVASAIVAETEQGAAVLVDCLTLWLSNLMAAQRDPEQEAESLVRALGQAGGPVVFVSNEVGLGIVPDNALARAFRDHAGRLNQRIADVANSVFFVAAGLPLRLK
ncbi:MAG TPA: bifunctional adenosylcobinamide kinase/adenosylcobinamide-phosphate guanylyltransferase [Dongiaceae bacterium]|nr:bifunctional adenosylcobinamide kinase/adenosylcobinamide-phosphate guanylyltransferase [Dongiaceae bacterium]